MTTKEMVKEEFKKERKKGKANTGVFELLRVVHVIDREATRLVQIPKVVWGGETEFSFCCRQKRVEDQVKG